MSNRLAQETSPYLKQHQNNPVDWYPWGPEALERAKAENKPILLSLGYSACHWCHVMEHESFENPQTAALMNERFINIKVDREERPDLDQIYQNVAQAMTGGGGWPLTVVLTPELKPFFGGTYYPPEDRWGRPGFPRVLVALSDAYRNQPDAVAENAQKLTEFIQSLEPAGKAGDQLPTQKALDSIAEKLLSETDWQNGGIGGAPKFPNPMMLDFLWRQGGEKSQEAVVLTLNRMASGGIYDQLGGGFHRYSVDATWSVPHFEKMLYDNGLLLRSFSQILLSRSALLDADQRLLFMNVISETTAYLLREMRSPEGGFYAAQDADSEGEEGKFFVWDLSDLKRILTADEARVIQLRYGVSEGGNFEHGKTVLHLAESLEEIGRQTKKSASEISELLLSARQKLLRARGERIAPATDDKVLASWNGLAISGLTWAAQALKDAGRSQEALQASQAAAQAFAFLREKLAQPGHRLFSTLQKGQPKLNAYLDDYAFLAMAALDLARFEADESQVQSYVGQAVNWMETVRRHFKDSRSAGYFFTSDDHEKLIRRPKTIYDQAIPSGTGVVLNCLLALSEIDPQSKGGEYAREAEAQLRSLFHVLEERPYGYGELLNASLLWMKGPAVVSGLESQNLIRRPEIFRKPAAPGFEDKIIACHRGTCGEPSMILGRF